MLVIRKFAFASLVSTALTLLLGGCASFAKHDAQGAMPWTATWGASEAVPAANGQAFNNQTLRLIVHTTLGGDQIRLRIANTFGAKPLVIGAASVALQSNEAALVAKSARSLTFNGRNTVSIPPGALIVSDPVALQVAVQTNLAVSLFVPSDTGP